MKSLRRVFKKSLAMELLKKGHNLVDLEPNFNHKNFVVYVFEDTSKLRSDLSKFTQ